MDRGFGQKVRKVRFKWKSPLSNSFRILFIKIGKYAKVGIVNSPVTLPISDPLILCGTQCKNIWVFYIQMKTNDIAI